MEDALVESEVEIQADAHFADSAELSAHATLGTDEESAHFSDEAFADDVDTMEAGLTENTIIHDNFEQVKRYSG